MRVVGNYRYANQKADDDEDETDPVEKRKRTVVLEKRSDHKQYLETVRERVQLGFRSLRAVSVFDGHFGNAPTLIDGMDGQFRLDLEAGGFHRERFCEYLVEAAVSGHDVAEFKMIDMFDEGADEVVSEAVERAVVLLPIGAV